MTTRDHLSRRRPHSRLPEEKGGGGGVASGAGAGGGPEYARLRLGRRCGPGRKSESPVRVAGPSHQSESPVRVAGPSRRSESPVRVADPSLRSESPALVADPSHSVGCDGRGPSPCPLSPAPSFPTCCGQTSTVWSNLRSVVKPVQCGQTCACAARSNLCSVVKPAPSVPARSSLVAACGGPPASGGARG